jgi:hypothetical protein
VGVGFCGSDGKERSRIAAAACPRGTARDQLLRPHHARARAPLKRAAPLGPRPFRPRLRSGFRTALVERGDWGCGTSSKSTKLVHGGVRYLEKAVFNLDSAQLKLVYEALQVGPPQGAPLARVRGLGCGP